jgi:K+-transporting ATPase ATPase C chain
MTRITNSFATAGITAIRLLLGCTLIAGFAYPAATTLIAQVFSEKANGSLVNDGKRITGSELIGQNFSRPEYFSSRPSACAYATTPSSASNLAPSSAALEKSVAGRRTAFAAAHGVAPQAVPADMLYASGSGLDPHISPDAAFAQLHRVAKARKLSGEQEAKLRALAASHIEQPSLLIFGDPRVNVLLLNMAADRMFGHE